MREKKCSKCRKVKVQEEDFYHWTGKDGRFHYQAWCKECMKVYQRKNFEHSKDPQYAPTRTVPTQFEPYIVEAWPDTCLFPNCGQSPYRDATTVEATGEKVQIALCLNHWYSLERGRLAAS